jgi:hypothetical protein
MVLKTERSSFWSAVGSFWPERPPREVLVGGQSRKDDRQRNRRARGVAVGVEAGRRQSNPRSSTVLGLGSERSATARSIQFEVIEGYSRLTKHWRDISISRERRYESVKSDIPDQMSSRTRQEMTDVFMTHLVEFPPWTRTMFF